MVRSAFFSHCSNYRFQNSFSCFQTKYVSHYGSGSVSTHTTGVRTFVIIKDAFVVLSSNHGNNGFAVGESQEGCFFAFHVFFQYHASACITKFLVSHHVVNSFQSFFFGHCNYYAFTCSQAVSFNYDGSTFFFYISFSSFDIFANFEECSGDIVFCHQFFRECFRAFQLSSSLGRAEHRQATTFENVSDTCNKSCFRTNNGQFNTIVFSKVSNFFQIIQVQSNTFTFGQFCDARVTRSSQNGFNLGALSQFPRQCVFTTATTDKQNFHISTSLIQPVLSSDNR